ncbi:MAG: CARDB domain-containing protein [Archaeoglobaceae archaeon]
MNSKAVSPLIGFILLMAIVMGLIGILQSTAVPQWNKAVEAKHLSELKYGVADVSKAISLSASTGNPAKIVLKAGVDYPNYYVLVSPPKASTTISTKDLGIRVEGNVSVGGERREFRLENTTSAIIVEPNYFYSSRSKLIYEHSAVLRLENSFVLKESDQSSFSNNSISLYIIKANFKSFATTESANLIFIPVSVGGRNLFSGNISLECFDEKTAEWWNSTLSDVYRNNSEVKVSRTGNVVSLENLKNITLSISVFEAYALTSGEILPNPSQVQYNLIAITSTSFKVYLYSTLGLGARVVDNYGNPIRGVGVVINDPCNGDTQKISDGRGEVWYYFNANCTGNQLVNFVADGSTVTFNINVEQPPSSGGGGTFTLTWFNESGETNNELWTCDEYTCEKEFTLNVKYQGSNVQGALVNFALNNNIISLVSQNTSYTNSDGNAIVRVRATNTTLGLAYLIGIVGDTVKILPINVITTLLFPDLIVSSISFNRTTIVVNQPVMINATVNNTGNADAGGFNVKFYINNSLLDTKRVLSLGAGSSTIVGTTWTPNSAGDYLIRVVADADGEVAESNENNNETSIIVTVQSPPTYTLTLTVCGGQDRWYVKVNPPNQNCYVSLFTCNYYYPSGTLVDLTARPPGNFVEWRGDCSGSSTTCNLVMNSDKQVWAIFSGCGIGIEPIEPPTPPPTVPPYI